MENDLAPAPAPVAAAATAAVARPSAGGTAAAACLSAPALLPLTSSDAAAEVDSEVGKEDAEADLRAAVST